MHETHDYKLVVRYDMLGPHQKILQKLNAVATVSVLICCAVGSTLNYCLRMYGQAGGMYFVYILCGSGLCLVYPYVHELAHAFAVIAVKGKAPSVKFGKLAACCGSPFIIFSKPQYFFAAAFPFLFFGVAAIPVCIFLPAMFFPIAFMPAVYNLFCSMGDFYMINKAAKAPRGCAIIDGGTEISVFIPTFDKK